MKVLTAAMLLVAMAGSTALAAPPSNDDFDFATVVTGLPFSDSVDTTEATSAVDDPDCIFGGIASPTVWYAFTPAEDMEIGANTFGSDYDTVLEVYTGTRGALDLVACNDDAGSLQSFVRFDATVGETYFFMVGAFAGGSGGALVFSVDVAPPQVVLDLTIDRFGRFVPRIGEAVISGTLTCSEPVSGSVGVFLSQRVGRRFLIEGSGDVDFECEGETDWSAMVTSSNGLFAGGPAKVSASAFAQVVETGEFVFSDNASASVRLRGK